MSFHEKFHLVSIGSAVVITTLYALVVLGMVESGRVVIDDILRFWGAVILILVPVQIVLRILIYIVFMIIHHVSSNEEEPSISDERDKLIELRATRNTCHVFVGGFLLAMLTLVLGGSASGMFLVLAAAMLVSDVIGELTQFLLYRRGF